MPLAGCDVEKTHASMNDPFSGQVSIISRTFQPISGCHLSGAFLNHRLLQQWISVLLNELLDSDRNTPKFGLLLSFYSLLSHLHCSIFCRGTANQWRRGGLICDVIDCIETPEIQGIRWILDLLPIHPINIWTTAISTKPGWFK